MSTGISLHPPALSLLARRSPRPASVCQPDARAGKQAEAPMTRRWSSCSCGTRPAQRRMWSTVAPHDGV